MNVTEQVDAAIAEVTQAEDALAGLLRALEAGVRAEKVAASEAVTQAFTRLRSARLALSNLREVLAREPPK